MLHFIFISTAMYREDSTEKSGCAASEGDSVRGSPCGEPARLCPPFFLQRGYPRERISSGSGALYLTSPPSCGDSAGPSRCDAVFINATIRRRASLGEMGDQGMRSVTPCSGRTLLPSSRGHTFPASRVYTRYVPPWQVCSLKAPAPNRDLSLPYTTPQRSIGGWCRGWRSRETTG